MTREEIYEEMVSEETKMAHVKANLYLGANIHNGEKVTDKFFSLWLSKFNAKFPGFTLTLGRGHWQGEAEDVRIVSVIMEDTTALRKVVRDLAGQYKIMFSQDCVGLEFQPVSWELV